MAIDTVSLACTAPSTGAAMAAVTGDSLSIRNAVKGTDILLLSAWAKSQVTAGFTQILWPSGHDLVRGIRARHVPAQLTEIIPQGMPAHFHPQDPLTVTQSGSATGGDVQFLTMLVFYEDLPGVDAHLIDMAALRRRGERVLTVEDTITGTAATGYTGARALNAASDLLRADTEYAVVGCNVGIIAACITLRGVDTGNLRVPIPASPVVPQLYHDYFMRLSDSFGLPTIPVINSANRAGIFIEVLQDENNTAVPLNLVLVELAPK